MGKRKYSKKALPGFTDAQRRWAEDYEGKTGIEPMHLDEACDIGFDEFAKRNIGWFEDWTSEGYKQDVDL